MTGVSINTGTELLMDAGHTWTGHRRKLVSWHVGPSNLGSAYTIMMDLAERLRNRLQLTSDRQNPYRNAVEDAFG